MQLVIIIVFFLMQSMLLLAFARQTDLITAYDIQNREHSIMQLSTAINSYQTETSTYPASITALATTPGYEYLKNTARPHQSMATTTNLDDTLIKYNRVAVFTQDPYDYPLTDTDYLSAANNTCGTGTFAAATDWCGNDKSRWWKHETRENLQADLIRERKRQRRLLDKFNGWYNNNQAYPDPLAVAARLTNLVTGYAQTATTCTGTYIWTTIPIDCTDLYSIWGTPTVYNYLSATHIAIVTSTPYTKSDGTKLYVSTELQL